MAHKINPDKCIACGSCFAECPAGAIKEGDVYSIDPDVCLDCGACEEVCPQEAISAE
ncbi:MAG: 4Fe-4S binding protein [Bacteroidales bacterium]|nr:4Fe-4S binding protein [Bacteroidales bacterium]